MYMKDSILRARTSRCLLLAFALAAGTVSTYAQRSGGAPLPTAPVTQDRLLVITQSADPSYVLQPNDFIQLAVFQEDDLNTTTRISKSGTIDLPLIGTVHIGGTSVAKAAAMIRSALMQGFIRDPQVSLTVIEFAKRRYSVLGEVRSPGSYEMPQQENVSLLEAISNAGGYTKIADPGKVTVRRTVGGKEEVYQLNAKAMARDSKVKPFTVEPGDTITVAESLF